MTPLTAERSTRSDVATVDCQQVAARARRSGGAVRAAKRTAKRAVARAGCGFNRLLGSRAGERFGILMYHRVVDRAPGVVGPTWNVPPAAFRKQLSGLLDRGFRAVPLNELIEAASRGVAPQPKTFVVTFDDGYESVHRYAWPVLKELRVPATLFLPTAYIDETRPFPFDDWSAAGSDQVPADAWRPMTTRQCREIAADGLVTLAAHSHAHRDNSEDLAEFERDLIRNLERLATDFRVERPAFAFPFGCATGAMMNIVRKVGCTCGLTTRGDLVNAADSPFGWGRFDVESWDTAATLAAKLSGWYSWAPTLRRLFAAGEHSPAAAASA